MKENMEKEHDSKENVRICSICMERKVKALIDC